MPYSPYRRGPTAVALAALVAVAALIVGLIYLVGGHALRGAVLLGGTALAIIVALLARPPRRD